MRFFEYNYKTFDGEDKTLKLRLVSGDMKLIEKYANTSLLDYVSQPTITMITTMLRYMNRSHTPNYSEKDADNLYDELVDAGFTMENIYIDLIMEALVVSGMMKKEELDDMKTRYENRKEEAIEEGLEKTPRGKNK